MDNNDILRRLRFALRLDDAKVAALCTSVGHPVVVEQVRAWLADDPVPCRDADLAAFLDGLIVDRRGPHDGPKPPERPLDNNEILKKLRIALTLRVDDVVAAIHAGGQALSATEVGALFRSPDHRHYLPAGNQVLRAFLTGLTHKLRPQARPQGQPRANHGPPRPGGNRPPGPGRPGPGRPGPAPGERKKPKGSRRRLGFDASKD